MTDQMDMTAVAAAVIVARVPVVDSTRAIVGFELVNRTTLDDGSQPVADDTQTVVTVAGLLGSVDTNISAVISDKLLFWAVDRTVILSEDRLTLPSRRTVLEVPTCDVDDPFLDSIRAYKRAGFTIMVEHEAWTEETEALLALADMVKIDLRTGTPRDIMDIVDVYADASLDLVATGCDTEAELSWAQAVGFDLFLGHAVQAPQTPDEAASAPLPVSQVQLAIELLSQDLDFDRIEDVLRGDPALVVQLLTMTSMGAGGGLRRQVRSLREALVVMGTTRLRQWAAVVILSRHCQRQTDALVTALVRARMCELLARSRGVDAPFAFTAGLLSALNILLGVPVAEIEQQVTVDEDLSAAAFRRQGAVGQLITRVTDHESWAVGSRPQDDHAEVTMLGAMAFSWATTYVMAMDSAGQE